MMMFLKIQYAIIINSRTKIKVLLNGISGSGFPDIIIKIFESSKYPPTGTANISIKLKFNAFLIFPFRSWCIPLSPPQPGHCRPVKA